MSGPVQTISRAVRNFWFSATGQGVPAAAGVILHDPAAQRAHDLDDPFFDDKIQTRVARVIAGARQKKS